MGYIYKITHTDSGKCYIGQTVNLDERWYTHKNKIKSNCRYLKHALNKYGVDNFQFTLLCICFDKDMDKYEEQYMKSFDSKVPNGYNLRDGGNGGRHHEETKQKISSSLKGKKRTDVSPWVGRKHSEETKKLISEKLKGKNKSVEQCQKMSANATKKPVAQYDANGTFIQQFESCRSTARFVDVDARSISDACKRGHRLHGYYYKYINT
jgi:group I intron endonuclease